MVDGFSITVHDTFKSSFLTDGFYWSLSKQIPDQSKEVEEENDLPQVGWWRVRKLVKSPLFGFGTGNTVQTLQTQTQMKQLQAPIDSGNVKCLLVFVLFLSRLYNIAHHLLRNR